MKMHLRNCGWRDHMIHSNWYIHVYQKNVMHAQNVIDIKAKEERSFNWHQHHRAHLKRNTVEKSKQIRLQKLFKPLESIQMKNKQNLKWDLDVKLNKGKKQLHTFRKQLLSLAWCAIYCIYIISLIHTECKFNLCVFFVAFDMAVAVAVAAVVAVVFCCTVNNVKCWKA